MSVEQCRGWAWVAGASEGLGLAFAEELAARGYATLLFARRKTLLEQHCARLRTEYGLPCVAVVADLAEDSSALFKRCLDDYPPILGVYNAAYVPAGAFLDQPWSAHNTALAVNISGPASWMFVLGHHMARQGRGSLVLMSSLAGEQGAAGIATYAATKAFNTRLAEGLWEEFRAKGVRVLVTCAGAVSTPGYAKALSKAAVGTLTPQQVAQATLDRLTQPGGPRFIPGWTNYLGAWVLGRLLPRALAVRLMSRITRQLEAET